MIKNKIDANAQISNNGRDMSIDPSLTNSGSNNNGNPYANYNINETRMQSMSTSMSHNNSMTITSTKEDYNVNSTSMKHVLDMNDLCWLLLKRTYNLTQLVDPDNSIENK